MELKFRDVTADEIDCRVATVKQNGCSLLLYKDARCDQNILDETVGAMNWQRAHTRDNANCIVSIWDTDKNAWVSKEDTGTESYTEKEKGLASDSFKRACFNWGIGRELYTAPFIWVSAKDCEIKQNGTKYTTYDRFEVSKMKVENKKITELEVINVKTGNTVFKWAKRKKAATKKKEEPKAKAEAKAPEEPELTPSFVHEVEVEAPKTREEFASPMTAEEKAAVIREMRRTLVPEKTLTDCVKKPMTKWTRGEAHSILRRLAKTRTRTAEKAPEEPIPVEKVVNDAELPWGTSVSIEDL